MSLAGKNTDQSTEAARQVFQLAIEEIHDYAKKRTRDILEIASDLNL